jgi:Na+-transporting methylmalonyl-CoA/oxaloacetate decarboxylase gamma subunit
MIDWTIVAKIWAGYGVNIIVLIVLLLIAWVVGILVQRLRVKDKEHSEKG